ncbi:MAG TPA: Lpg1974 family pore-forming outer membrane protein [Pirellulales bacterium]|nr:Lpg1974 family pore-forming outer membrane protein [Pirellulales bacterium]
MDTYGHIAPARRRHLPWQLLLTAGLLSQAATAAGQSVTVATGGTLQPSAIAASYAAGEQSNTTPFSTTSYSRNQRPAYSPTWSYSAPRGIADSVYGGAEYLLIRTHFSEAIAFVQVNQSLSGGLPQQSVTSQEINFPYNSAFRTYVGYQFTPKAALQLTYFHLGTSVKVNGSPSSAGQTLVDAYGDVASFGQTMATNTSVQLNVFDLDFVGRYTVNQQITLRPAVGVRWADVRQHNDSSVIDPSAGIIGTGRFNTHYTGFGPHASLLGQAHLRPNSPFSLIARGAGSLLVGNLNNDSGAVFTGVASGGQSTNRTLTVPVIEAELGGAWQPTENLMFSAGWLWQAWFDLGASGGTTYNGKFSEADSASIMSFDGLFLRGMWRY